MPETDLPLAGLPSAGHPEQPALPAPVAAAELRRPADLSGLAFDTTDDLEPLEGLVGQRRALDALEVATRLERTGFNLFVVGSNERIAREAVISTLKSAARERAKPVDWIYVNNFKEPHKPIAIALPAGRAPAFQGAMRTLVEDLKAALPAVFQSEEYQAQRAAIDEAYQQKQAELFSNLQKKATAQNIALLRTPMGFALVPAREGKVVPPDEFNALPQEEREAIQKVVKQLEEELERIVRQIPRWEKDRRDEIKRLNGDTTQATVDPQINEVLADYSDLPQIVDYMEAVRADLVDNVAIFILKDEEASSESEPMMPGSAYDRYRVNLFVSQAEHDGAAPVIEELHPTLSNLTGRVEHIASQGVLVTNFGLIKAGALHRANGGFLVLDARALLSEAFSWTALKRALRRGTIVIEDINRLIGLTSTISLEPAPIPLDLKVILFGDRLIHFLLAMLDPELEEHFKIVADFEDDMERSADSEALLVRLFATILRREKLRTMERDAAALLIEQAARMAENARKLSLSADQLRDILAEADHYAGLGGRTAITRADLQKALDQRIDRASRIRERLQEQILREVALIDTDGACVGQINGLSVLQLAGQSFGRPSRITCSVRPGAGKVVDIEREVELGGPLHSKGVMILSGFLAGRFALDAPMSLQASLVFEQSYAGVEGDSASSAELYALLSAIAGVPLRQDLAVTGSVNQHGEVQAIGGVNDKIEGFFDVCAARGLTGRQGVLIPKSNVQHLMLRQDVVEACAAGGFAVYPVASIDQGLALLTGLPAGGRGADGAYPEGSVYRLVEDRLRAFAEIRRSLARQDSLSSPNDKNGES
ncbi:Lon protease family protein [Polymorphum gilvum]|uniref:endopeptidase La n=1 Tax=Polymorphum gilvum (strain LMG 25793 / CGMCC 1.9160 / SL003B-26A1) TaxID=991905 RepID=F2J4A3_POLGS|nr:ATP-binding protein [Polymorphum gilvum]ADZ71045.1 Peptidase S16, lon-like protein [Polymorphum gilvum SL003B-26A1]